MIDIFCDAGSCSDPLSTFIWRSGKRVAYFSITVAVLYILILLLHFRGPAWKTPFVSCASIVLGFEMFENTQLGVQEVSTSDYASYPTMAEAVAVLNEDIANDSDDLFYRTEMSSQYSLERSSAVWIPWIVAIFVYGQCQYHPMDARNGIDSV